jgi:predicted nuclease of predicted toxin-antitoxin system
VRFLADENVSPVIVQALRDAGHDAESVTVTMPSAPDEDVLRHAIAERRMLVTEDKDFGELAFKHGLHPTAIIRLVLPGLWPSEKAQRLIEVIVTKGQSLVGHATVVEANRTRSRRMDK